MWCHWAAKYRIWIRKHAWEQSGSLYVAFFEICVWFLCASPTLGSFGHMHQQVLLPRWGVAVGRLQALVLCLKVCHCYSGFSLTMKPEPLLQTRTQEAVEGRIGNGGGLSKKRRESTGLVVNIRKRRHVYIVSVGQYLTTAPTINLSLWWKGNKVRSVGLR